MTSATEAPQRGELLAHHTSFRIGGFAPEFHSPETVEELASLLNQLEGSNPFILGGGCNTLFPDAWSSRPIVSTRRLNRIEVRGEQISAEAGVRTEALLRAAMRAGLGGIEGLVGIPGTVGGATAMNAGGRGWSFGERVVEVTLVPEAGGRPVTMNGRELPWSYRFWGLSGYCIARVVVGLEPLSRERLRERVAELARRKTGTQPLAEPSAGCVFKNPPGFSAGFLIDSLGLKGMRVGGAVVSERHANFIVNRGARASASDVLRLIAEVRRRVLAAYEIRLETEVVLPSPVPERDELARASLGQETVVRARALPAKRV